MNLPAMQTGAEGCGNLLANCVVEYPTKYPGLVELKWCPRSFDLDAVLSVPGVFQTRPNPKTGKAQLYAPWNLWVAGRRPATLKELPEDPTATTPSGLELTWYQRRVVSFGRSLQPIDGGAILAPDPGLGKTIAALQILHLDGFLKDRILILGPLVAYDAWCSEDGDPSRHYGLRIEHLNTTAVDQARLQNAQIVFVHYDVLKPWSGFLFNWRPRAVIIDESHMLANPDSARTKDVLALTGGGFIERRLALTGTPIPKTRMDLWAQLAIVQPNQWGRSKTGYGVRYAAGRQVLHSEDQAHWVFDGQTNTDELRARLAGVYLRVTKAQVPGAVPGLKRHAIEVRLPDEMRAQYARAQIDIKQYKDEELKPKKPSSVIIAGEELAVPEKSGKDALQLVVTGALRSLLDRGKLPTAMQEAIRLCGIHRRLVVFTWKIESAELIYNWLSQAALAAQQSGQASPSIYGPIDGSVKPVVRIQVAKAFASAPWSILVATGGSLSVSINPLAAADALLQTMPEWNPDTNLQLESRLQRLGSKSEEICCYYLIARGTLDDRVLTLMDEKAREAAELSDDDRSGMHLVADLEGGALKDGSLSLAEICRQWSEMEQLAGQGIESGLV